MKRVLILAVLLLTAATVFGQTVSVPLKSSGRAIKGIDASSVFNVSVVQSNESSAIVTVPKRYEKNVILRLESDGTLILGLKGNIKTKRGEDFKAYVTCPTIQKLETSSAARITINSNFTTPTLEVETSSASKVESVKTITVQGNCSLESSSASTIVLGIVSTGSIDVETSSASKIELTTKARIINVDATSASKVSLSCNAETINVDTSSGSKVEVSGTTNIINIDASSGSRVSCEKLSAQHSNIESDSGASIDMTSKRR